MAKLRIATLLLIAAFPGGLAAQPAHRPATMIDAIAGASGPGWSTVTLADGRPMALYRTRSGASLALGCRGDGVLVVAGGPAPIVRLVSEEDEEIIPIALERVALRGARDLIAVLRSEGNPAGHELFLGAEEIPVAEASPHVAPVAEHCAARLARSRPPEVDTVAIPAWSGSTGFIVLTVRGGEGRSALRLGCDADARRLSIEIYRAPTGARAGQQATIVVATPTGRFSYRGRVMGTEMGAGPLVTTAVVGNGSALLNALSTEDGFATGFGTAIDAVHPAQGLAGLIERRLSACR